MVYGKISNVKNTLGQTTNINDAKIGRYQIIAYNWINSSLTNIEVTIPIPTPDPYIVNFEEQLSAAYFWKFESGDTITADSLEKQFLTIYFKNKYNRPNTITRVY